MVSRYSEPYRFRDWYVPDRMLPGLELYVTAGVVPGSFLQAVLENDLGEACGRADDENLANLPAFCAWLYNVAPAGCYGSKERVQAWVARFQSKPENAAAVAS